MSQQIALQTLYNGLARSQRRDQRRRVIETTFGPQDGGHDRPPPRDTPSPSSITAGLDRELTYGTVLDTDGVFSQALNDLGEPMPRQRPGSVMGVEKLELLLAMSWTFQRDADAAGERQAEPLSTLLASTDSRRGLAGLIASFDVEAALLARVIDEVAHYEPAQSQPSDLSVPFQYQMLVGPGGRETAPALDWVRRGVGQPDQLRGVPVATPAMACRARLLKVELDRTRGAGREGEYAVFIQTELSYPAPITGPDKMEALWYELLDPHRWPDHHPFWREMAPIDGKGDECRAPAWGVHWYIHEKVGMVGETDYRFDRDLFPGTWLCFHRSDLDPVEIRLAYQLRPQPGGALDLDDGVIIVTDGGGAGGRLRVLTTKTLHLRADFDYQTEGQALVDVALELGWVGNTRRLVEGALGL